MLSPDEAKIAAREEAFNHQQKLSTQLLADAESTAKACEEVYGYRHDPEAIRHVGSILRALLGEVDKLREKVERLEDAVSQHELSEHEDTLLLSAKDAEIEELKATIDEVWLWLRLADISPRSGEGLSRILENCRSRSALGEDE